MITVTMHTNHKGLYDGFHIEGHADGFEKDGEYDLICASVSAITLTIAAGLRDVLHMEGTFDSDFGYMDVHLDSPGEVNFMLLFNLQLFAHKKGVSSTKNGRDSNAQRLGTKMHAGQIAKPGNIIVRQRGTHLHPGLNVKLGKDDTLFATAEGRIAFERLGRDKRQVSVYPVNE